MRLRNARGNATYPATFGLVIGLANRPGDDMRWMYLCRSQYDSISAIYLILSTGQLTTWADLFVADNFVAVDHLDPETADAAVKVWP